MDSARRVTDQQISSMRREFAADYDQLGSSMSVHLAEYLADFVDGEGRVTESALHGRGWSDMRGRLADKVYGTNRAAMADTARAMDGVRDLTSEGSPSASAMPHPSIDMRRDIRWNEQKIEAAARSGIGRTPAEAGERMRRVADMNYNATARRVRTAVNGAENAGRMDAMLARGGSKRWVTMADELVRESHAELHGMVVPVDEEFPNGLMFPGDPSGPPEEVYNCRCTLEWVDTGSEADEVEYGGDSPEYVAEDIGTAPVRPRASDFDDPDELDAARSAYRADREAFESRRQELVDEIASQPGHGYGTREEVMSWADRRGVTVTEEVLDAVDSRTMDEIVDVSDRLMEKYPEVLQSFESVGGKYVIGLSDDRSVFMEAGGGLKLNPSYFPDYRSAVDHVVDGYTHASYSEQVGRDLAEMVRGDGTFRTSVTHEFGHNLDSTIRYGLDIGDVSAYRSDLMDLTRGYTTSEYAMVNELEAFAEGFAEMECNPTSEYARAFAEFLRRWR